MEYLSYYSYAAVGVNVGVVGSFIAHSFPSDQLKLQYDFMNKFPSPLLSINSAGARRNPRPMALLVSWYTS